MLCINGISEYVRRGGGRVLKWHINESEYTLTSSVNYRKSSFILEIILKMGQIFGNFEAKHQDSKFYSNILKNYKHFTHLVAFGSILDIL